MTLLVPLVKRLAMYVDRIKEFLVLATISHLTPLMCVYLVKIKNNPKGLGWMG